MNIFLDIYCKHCGLKSELLYPIVLRKTGRKSFWIITNCECSKNLYRHFIDAFCLLPEAMYKLKENSYYIDYVPTQYGMKNIRELDTTIYPYIPTSTPRHISDKY